MSTWKAVQCAGCGGAVATQPGTALPACLFCGADASQLVAFEPEGIEPPEGFLPFAIDAAAAREAFIGFASSSMWYPGDLRRAKVELRQLLLPAWAWSGSIESHWTGTVRASSASGKRPIGGSETLVMAQVLVPASQSLRLAELSALGRYDETALQSMADGQDPGAPHELSEVTRSVARQAAQAEMGRRHQAKLASDSGAGGMSVASVCENLTGRPVLVPVWIGAYRYGDKVFRVLVNGQSGTFHGDAPISWWRVAGAVFAGLMLLGAVAGAVSLCGGAALVAR
jgi:hypothetical protein